MSDRSSEPVDAMPDHQQVYSRDTRLILIFAAGVIGGFGLLNIVLFSALDWLRGTFTGGTLITMLRELSLVFATVVGALLVVGVLLRAVATSKRPTISGPLFTGLGTAAAYLVAATFLPCLGPEYSHQHQIPLTALTLFLVGALLGVAIMILNRMKGLRLPPAA
jgi:hypothetical protein